MIEKTEEFIEKFRYKPTKSNQVQSRVKQLERLERIEIDDEDLSTLTVKFPPAPRSGDVAFEVKDAVIGYEADERAWDPGATGASPGCGLSPGENRGCSTRPAHGPFFGKKVILDGANLIVKRGVCVE